MKRRIVATWPQAPRTKEAQRIAWVYAAILVLMSVGQLFSFEKLGPLLDGYGDAGIGLLLATISVISCVLALPFLLGMRLSLLMRWWSMIAGWIVPVLWTTLSVLAVTLPTSPQYLGLLGASVPLELGWWAVFACIGLGLLAAWASWGLWPGRRTTTS